MHHNCINELKTANSELMDDDRGSREGEMDVILDTFSTSDFNGMSLRMTKEGIKKIIG